jgi:hypothetical protein
MESSKAAVLLSMMAVHDFRPISEFDAEQWGEALGDLDWDQCCRAIKDHYRSSGDPMKVADVRKRVEVMNRPTEDRKRRKDLRQELPPFDPELNARGSAAVRAALAERHTGEVPSAQQAT